MYTFLFKRADDFRIDNSPDKLMKIQLES